MLNMWLDYKITPGLIIKILKQNILNFFNKGYITLSSYFVLRLHKADFILSIVAQVRDVADDWPLVLKFYYYERRS